MSEEKPRYVRSNKSGKFQVSISRSTKTIPNTAARLIISEEALIHYSETNYGRQYNEQKIHCSLTELKDLEKALEEIGDPYRW
ncbi:MAG: hypothetical protein JRI35_02950 [Deltaproteobacteria bacterium]|nr:hypothetical protein [Deltaproteobacteria bacterium]